ncbi:unnamed protein product [Lactuca virosa]|uniref:PWWP domain-containing protein n=1 Tax=Lactuca virosa TaxID=75947 RepID=A0AAU9PLK3_9ASTR|nr:unnamed protein product [Lactuca virosa]
MESSDAETGMVDCGVGTIVWVRRRNGSWWPGKILGPDELSASPLMSPRSGTPVKLLGREDASVDWYNLEKSKRVKPFRCGEFDDCIERAEASQGMPPKKREKYARREDAILHALELEKQVLEKKYGKLGVQSNNTKLVGKDTTITPELSRDSGKHVDLSLDDKRKGLSFQSRSHLNVDDVPVRPILFKHKLSSLAASNGSHRNASDVLTPENTVIVGSKKLLEKKRKRSQEGNMEESVGKRRDRHRPLVQVLLSSAKLPHHDHTHPLQSKADGGEEQRKVVHRAAGGNDPGDTREAIPDQVENSAPKFEKRNESFPVALSEENTTESNEDTETDSSGTESLMSDTYDAMAAFSDEAEDVEFIPKAFGRQGVHEESMSDDESGGVPDDTVATVSKWQLKGKRNSRSLRKRKVATNSSHWMPGFNGIDTSLSLRSEASGGLLDMLSWDDDPDPYPCCLKGYSYSYSYSYSGEYQIYDDDDDDNDDDDDDVRRHGTRMLIDVEVGVQSSYQREHVPMISLMSKLNDKAIVGHPIPVEAVEDGSSDDMFQMESLLLLGGGDTSAPLQPWRTARRTAKCRGVALARPPQFLSTLEEEEEEEAVASFQFQEYYDEDGKASVNRSNSKGRKWAAPKKPQRRTTSSCSSQKIRTLSSIGGTQQQQQQQQQHNMDLKAEGEQGIGMMMMMMMKPESLPTAVACIPVKLVFSRLHEELVAPRHQ